MDRSTHTLRSCPAAGRGAGVTRSEIGLAVGLLGLAAVLFSAPPVAACLECTPGRPVDEQLWGELVPVDSDPLPGPRDSTNWGSNLLSTKDIPLWADLAFAGKADQQTGTHQYLFTAFVGGMEVWSLDDPERPVRLSALDGWDGDFLRWPGGGHDTEILKAVGAAPENDGLVVVGGLSFGVAVIDTRNKQEPRTIYQHSGFTVDSLHVRKIDNGTYAFSNNRFAGPVVYDLEAAKDLYDSTGQACLELKDEGGLNCPGVFLGRVGSAASSQIDGAGDGNRNYLASGRYYDKGVDLFDVSDPGAPKHLVHDIPEQVYGAALWTKSGEYYLAVRLRSEARIYRIPPSCLAGTCKKFGQSENLLWSRALPFGGSFQPATFSRSNGTPIVHFGNAPGAGPQQDFLFDVSEPSASRQIIPRAPDGSPKTLTTADGTVVNYFNWYYPTNPTGLSSFVPRRAKFSGPYLYRASRSVLDIHRWQGPSGPLITVEGPAQGWLGDDLSFTATPNSLCSAVTGGWTWETDGALIVTGQGSSQVTLRWPTTANPGSRTVTATNSGCPDATVNGQPIHLEDPEPAIARVTATPSTAPQCTPITFEAEGVTGRGTPAFSWAVTTDPETNGSGNPFQWSTDPLATGSNLPELTAETDFQATVTVTNSTCPAGSGCEATDAATVTLQPLAPLPGPGDVFKPTHDDHAAATVRFHADDTTDGVGLSGATEWAWDFDGDTVFPPFTDDPNDPTGGPDPVHTYTEKEILKACPDSTISSGIVTPPCTIPVKVQVKNCLNETGVISDALEVTIEQLTPLHAEFEAQANCSIAPCSPEFKVDQDITFTDKSTGAELYDYDWDGDGTYDTGYTDLTQPVTTFAYDEDGTFSPKLRVKRGTNETDVFTHPQITVKPAEPVEPPSISIQGLSSGSVGQSLTFTAQARNCSPSSNGWSWTASGLSVSDTDSSITVSFPSAGPKSVTASNSSCGNAQGRKTLSIQPEDDGGGDDSQFRARFTVDPPDPAVGQEVTFDGSGSTGDPKSYDWTFPGGETRNGAVVTFTFQEPGPATVELKVEKLDPDQCTGPLGFGLCTDVATKTITVSGDPANAINASFETTAECTVAGRELCTATTGEPVTFTATEKGADSYEWSFGDGQTRNGRRVQYKWSTPGTYTVKLTVEKAEVAKSSSKPVQVEGDPVSKVQAVVVPWIAQAGQGTALPQASDLNIHNTGNDPLKLEVTFKRRGKPEENPPSEEVTIPANATVQYPNVLEELLGVEDSASGFLEIEVISGSGKPVVSSANRTFADDGRIFGQVVPGVSLPRLPLPVKESPETLHLVGLNDTPDRLSYFGLTNPAERGLRFELRLYDKFGELTGEAPPEEPDGVRPQSQRQYQIEQLRERFGIEGLDDFRIEIVPQAGNPPPLVYAANLRLFSRDPSFLRAGRTDQDDVFLLGALNTPGLNDSLFQSDVVLANVDDGAAECAITFTPTGVRSEPTEAIMKDLPPRETLRLENVVSEWNVGNSVGVLRVRCDGEDGVSPVVQGESYDVSRPPELYGQFMPGLTAEQAARPGLPHSLVGLRQEDESRTTVWLYNPSEDEVALYAVRYFDSAGEELGGESDLRLGPGKFRQINPGHHPEEVQGDFVVRIEVSQGSVLSAAQVVNEANDPAYVVGR